MNALRTGWLGRKQLQGWTSASKYNQGQAALPCQGATVVAEGQCPQEIPQTLIFTVCMWVQCRAVGALGSLDRGKIEGDLY